MNGPTMEFSASSLVGQTFGGKYRVISELSQGGMGKIYKAEQIALGRSVAIKVIVADDDPVANKRFLLEASLTANLDHPNIVKIYDFGRTEDGVLFLVMELIQGENLESWVKNQGPLTPAETLRIGRQLSGALTESHSKKVVHRDIKPANIIITRRTGGELSATLIDFGLVKNADAAGGLSRTGMIVGTPMYMAPEQLSASGVDDRVDIYTLGLTLFYGLTGRDPYPDRGLSSLMHAQLNEPLEPVSTLSDAMGEGHLLDWIISTATAKDPGERFQNGQQLDQAMRACEAQLLSGEFPELTISAGALISSPEVVGIDESLPSAPLVNQDAYVKDGSAISTDFADAISMSGVLDPVMLATRADSHSSLEVPQVTVAGTKQSSTLTRPLLVVIIAAVVVGGWFMAQGEAPPVQAPVQAQVVDIELNSTPTGADVLVDGVLVGSTPFSIQLDQGEVTQAELKLQGYAPRTVALSSRTPAVTIRLVALSTLPAVQPTLAPAQEPVRAKPKVEAPEQPKSATPPKTKSSKAEGPRDPWAD